MWKADSQPLPVAAPEATPPAPEAPPHFPIFFSCQPHNNSFLLTISVWSLENGNAELELRIRQFLENKTSPGSRDYSAFFVSIADLHNKVPTDTSVEADFAGLKRLLDVLARSDLEMQIEGLKEELIFLKKNHEEMLGQRQQMTGQVNVEVEVDAGPTQDLNTVLSEIREQYEQASAKNKKELEAWFQEKAATVKQEVAVSTETNLNRLLQSLQRELQSQLTIKGSLEGTLQETENQATSLEEQLVNLQGDIDRQGQEYQMLLDTKTRLEMEIAEYRRLLDEYKKRPIFKWPVMDNHTQTWWQNITPLRYALETCATTASINAFT
uniref:Keratin 15 n=1 Tax=Gadus morhua TaxID=8049 RepID=A0A8C4ZN68_GADMO